jgi:hypothetical protein
MGFIYIYIYIYVWGKQVSFLFKYARINEHTAVYYKMKVTKHIIQSNEYTLEVIVQKTPDRYIMQLGGQKKSHVYIF